MNRICHNERGVALVVTLAIVAILIAAALQLGKFTGDSVMATQMDKDRYQAEQLAVSGIHLAMFILVDDATKNQIDSVQEAWADPDKLAQAIDGLGLEKGETLSINVIDEYAKIQANAVIQEFPGNLLNPDQEKLWNHFLALIFSNNKAMDERDPAEILNAVKDWLDSGDDDAITGLSGAESDYYLELDPPYTCANGPFNHVEELLSVKGISKDLLKAETIEETDEIDIRADLKDIFTVYGLQEQATENGGYQYPGKININTASAVVLAALLPVGLETLAQDLVDFRNQKGEQGELFINPLDKEWYKKVIDLSEKDQDQFDRMVKYSSDTFTIECKATKNDTSVILAAVVKREQDKESGKWMCRIIQMEGT